MHRETPQDGIGLDELFKARDVDIPAVMERLEKAAAELSLPWSTRTRTYNSRRAQELGKWVESLEKGDAFHMAAFQAYFVHGQNIGDVSVLRELVEAVGLDGREAEDVVAQGTFKETVDRDWNYSRSCGITAVPTFMVSGRRVVGAQPYKLLSSLSVLSVPGANRDSWLGKN